MPEWLWWILIGFVAGGAVDYFVVHRPFRKRYLFLEDAFDTRGATDEEMTDAITSAARRYANDDDG